MSLPYNHLLANTYRQSLYVRESRGGGGECKEVAIRGALFSDN
jgi:hypothetical protein